MRGLDVKIRPVPVNIKQNRPYVSYRMETQSIPYLSNFKNMFYSSGKKQIPRKLLKNSWSLLLFAVWFLDDGYVTPVNQVEGITPQCYLCTDAFTKDDINWLIKFLSKKGYPCHLRKHGKYNRIYFKKDGSIKLCQDIAPYAPTCMRYKTLHNSIFNFDIKLWGNGQSNVYYGRSVVKKYTGSVARLQTTYCIETDKGNFVGSSLVLHNCTQRVIYNGFKMQPNDIFSAIGIANLKGALDNCRIQKENARYYNVELKNIVQICKCPANGESSYWLYMIVVDRKSDFKKMMTEKGIVVSEVHTRMDEHPVYDKYKAFLPNMDAVQDKYIAIPVGWWLTPEDRQYIVETIKAGW